MTVQLITITMMPSMKRLNYFCWVVFTVVSLHASDKQSFHGTQCTKLSLYTCWWNKHLTRSWR